jgi:ferredoxin-NADP reductase
MVAITSIRAARARLRYESWHLLHLYAYLGVGLSLPHELWTGAEFVATPLARLYWWAAYLCTAGCVVFGRLGLPAFRTLRHDLRIERVVPETPGITSIYMRGRHLQETRVTAGQFFNWRFLGAPGWTRAHPYSLSAAPQADLLRITVKDLGDGSADVAKLRPGMRVIMEGPYGRLTGAVRQRPLLTFFACGIGITPLRALLESEFYRPGDAVLVYRASRPADFTFHREIAQLARSRGITVHYLAGHRRNPASWLPDGYSDDYPDDIAALRALTPRVAHGDVYICGPPAWSAALIDSLGRVGVPDRNVHTEKFGW